ncbi:hypothetical protein GCM10010218_23850 [Streptomyces mashuensis]|uniref:Malonyl-CoA:ACP transacylase (MAT) domain-containing protein n=1 Tax=Streptomyces mashuensis TaxID=33904 RepID=A0A919B1P7_9ACTN|nr:acyltransferase domain-containing protein [Streptomyces mashuensis]GHF41996.1 hypothetical protein GCM10010218_23850 [Streptomyces mashuensis]
MSTTPPPHRHVALLFPGQGSQYVRMAAGLHQYDPCFTGAFDEALGLMGADAERLRDAWLDERPGASVDDVDTAQPLLFAVEYALGRMLLGWGVRPAAMIGHSAGELVAAVLADVISLPDAARMVRERVAYLRDIPAGGMLAVVASAQELRPRLTGDVAIAAVNAGRQTMLAGTTAHLTAVAGALRAEGFTVLPVPATLPFHSPAMEPAVRAARAAFATVRLDAPRIPIRSGYTGQPLTPDVARSADYWARQLADTVQFGPALDGLLGSGDFLLIEAGPGQNLTTLARRHRAVRRGGSAATALLPARPGTPEDDRAAVTAVAALLRAEGQAQVPAWDAA